MLSCVVVKTDQNDIIQGEKQKYNIISKLSNLPDITINYEYKKNVRVLSFFKIKI